MVSLVVCGGAQPFPCLLSLIGLESTVMICGFLDCACMRVWLACIVLRVNGVMMKVCVGEESNTIGIQIRGLLRLLLWHNSFMRSPPFVIQKPANEACRLTLWVTAQICCSAFSLFSRYVIMFPLKWWPLHASDRISHKISQISVHTEERSCAIIAQQVFGISSPYDRLQHHTHQHTHACTVSASSMACVQLINANRRNKHYISRSATIYSRVCCSKVVGKCLAQCSTELESFLQSTIWSRIAWIWMTSYGEHAKLKFTVQGPFNKSKIFHAMTVSLSKNSPTYGSLLRKYLNSRYVSGHFPVHLSFQIAAASHDRDIHAWSNTDTKSSRTWISLNQKQSKTCPAMWIFKTRKHIWNEIYTKHCHWSYASARSINCCVSHRPTNCGRQIPRIQLKLRPNKPAYLTTEWRFFFGRLKWSKWKPKDNNYYSRVLFSSPLGSCLMHCAHHHQSTFSHMCTSSSPSLGKDHDLLYCLFDSQKALKPMMV